jgi:hypothetical protein
MHSTHKKAISFHSLLDVHVPLQYYLAKREFTALEEICWLQVLVNLLYRIGPNELRNVP